jgi:hypothetical protein
LRKSLVLCKIGPSKLKLDLSVDVGELQDRWNSLGYYSGCIQHMTGNPRMFTSLDENIDGQDKITFGDNSKGKVQGLGNVAISNDLSISNVLLVAPLSFNLLSVSQLCDLGLQCLFTPTEVVVSKMDDEQMLFKGFSYNNLYLVDFTSEDADLRTCLFTKASLGWLWHRRLTHVGMSTLKKVLKKDMVRGLKDVVFEKDKPCSACQAGKQVANTHPTKAFMSTSRPLELLHMDLFRPTTYASAGGNLYCLVIVDDFSRYTWVFFLHGKSEVASIFLPRRLKMNLIARSRRLEVTTVKNLITPTYMNIVMRLGSSKKYRQHTHLNKMELLRGRT